MPVRAVTEEELALCSLGSFDVFLALYVPLTTIHNSNVTCAEVGVLGGVSGGVLQCYITSELIGSEVLPCIIQWNDLPV